VSIVSVGCKFDYWETSWIDLPDVNLDLIAETTTKNALDLDIASLVAVDITDDKLEIWEETSAIIPSLILFHLAVLLVTLLRCYGQRLTHRLRKRAKIADIDTPFSLNPNLNLLSP
jgi:hypothetical protein